MSCCRRRRKFVMLLANSWTILAREEGYLEPWIMLPKVEQLVRKSLGAGYVEHKLNGGDRIFTAKGQPTLALVFTTAGTIPSERRFLPSYRLYIMVFAPGVTPLQLFYPCGL